MEYGFYHSKLGYWQTVGKPSDDVLASYPKGTIEISLKPSALHKLDGLQWVAPTQAELDAAKAIEVREERDYILATVVDVIVSNPLRWADLNEAKQTEWANYRRALLDLTLQDGFPNNVVWPTQPK